MSAVDVEALFHKFSVPEIRDIEKKVKTDIEKKKEDLRQMVGRRYRDVIEAADSIREMKLRADDILVSVKDVQKGFDRLSQLQQQLITAQQRAHMSTRSPVLPEMSLDTQLKFLQDLPELIWECLDEQDVLSAVWFVLLAESLNRGLSLQLTASDPSCASKRRVLDHYVSRVKNLRKVLLEQCQNILNWQDWLNAESRSSICCDCLCALACLENLSVEEVLDRLLNSQKNSLSVIFDDSECSTREQFCKCVAGVQWTVLAVDQMFSAQEKGQSSIAAKISAVFSGDWQPERMTQYLSQQSRTFNSALPLEIKNFHPTSTKQVSDADADLIRNAMGHWMEQCLEMSSESLSASLVFSVSVEALTVLKRSILETLAHVDADKWAHACRKTLSSGFSLWEVLIKDLLDKRLEALVSLGVEASFEGLKAAVAKNLSFSDQERSVDGLSFGRYMWTEMNSDTPKMTETALVSSLTLKARGIPPDVYGVCRKLDESLLTLQDSLEKHYSVGVEQSNAMGQRKRTRICSISGDLPEIWKCLAEACTNALNSFVNDMEKNIASKVSSQAYTELLYLIRQAQVCLCLCELCLGLKACLSYQSISDEVAAGLRARKAHDTELWKSTKTKLSKLAVDVYRLWADFVIEEAVKTAGFSDKGENVWIKWLQVSQEWESVSVEEETEAGQKVTSKLQVPIHCSRNLHRFLSFLCSSLNTLGAHRMPKQAMTAFVQKSLTSAIEYFEAVVKISTEGEHMPQKQALQLVFDLKVIAGLFLKSVVTEDQAALQKRIADLTDSVQSFIDPFDMDVLNQHMKRNIAKFFQKIMSLYGVLILSEAATTLSRAAPSAKIVAGSEQPQLIPLASGVSRFQLLPVAAPSKTELVSGLHATPVVHLHAAAVGGSQVGALQGKRERKRGKDDLPKSSSAAALSSFYDKISSSWFGM